VTDARRMVQCEFAEEIEAVHVGNCSGGVAQYWSF
jgi:hypothetical protein